MNLYNYVGGDPVNRVDPTGALSCTTTWYSFVVEGEPGVGYRAITKCDSDGGGHVSPPTSIWDGGGIGGGGGGGQSPQEQIRACESAVFSGYIGDPQFERQARRAMQQSRATPNLGILGQNPANGSEYAFFAGRYPWGQHIGNLFTSRNEVGVKMDILSGWWPFARDVILYHTHQSSSPGTTGSLSNRDIGWSNARNIPIIAENEDGTRYCYVP